ncbi:MAG: 30S ribosomal protein S16 [Verrucomicrobia bacterium]|nr:30S ribosomal protein S16 [Verrucomicrobiota bacterium]
MAVRIRLKRMGGLNDPHFRVVIADKHSPRDGRFIEEIGAYNPNAKGVKFKLDLERAKHWIGKGALPSDTVRSLIKKAEKTAATAAT